MALLLIALAYFDKPSAQRIPPGNIINYAINISQSPAVYYFYNPIIHHSKALPNDSYKKPPRI